MASYGEPRHLDHFRQLVYATPDGGFQTEPVDWSRFAPQRRLGEDFDERHADLAATVQVVLAAAAATRGTVLPVAPASRF